MVAVPSHMQRVGVGRTTEHHDGFVAAMVGMLDRCSCTGNGSSDVANQYVGLAKIGGRPSSKHPSLCCLFHAKSGLLSRQRLSEPSLGAQAEGSHAENPGSISFPQRRDRRFVWLV